jgi:2-hydroxychromene-2-carboxylate isomerase
MSVVTYYSARSSYAYLGMRRLMELAGRHGRTIVHRPIKLSVTMGPIGGQPFDERPPLRTAYSLRDMQRWAEHLGIEILDDPIHHDGPMELPSGAIISAGRAKARGEPGDQDELAALILEALWRFDRDIADRAVIGELLERAGFAQEPLLDEALSGEVQLELARNCREAIVKGVVGSPTYFVDGENFYGQDRLDFVERWLAQR